MLVIGLIGPMGAGKSVVLGMLAARGAVPLRADDTSRELLARESRLLPRVRELLGAEVFASDGSLDRARAAELIFRDADARRRLEELLHPEMVAIVQERLRELRQSTPPPALVVLEAAILTRMGLRPVVDAVVRVWAEPEACLRRLQGRDNVDRAEAERRLGLHMELGLLSEPADYVVDTSGTMAETEAAVTQLCEWLDRRANSSDLSSHDA